MSRLETSVNDVRKLRETRDGISRKLNEACMHAAHAEMCVAVECVEELLYGRRDFPTLQHDVGAPLGIEASQFARWLSRQLSAFIEEHAGIEVRAHD